LITSRNNAIIKEARRLRQEGGRRARPTFLVEGIHLVGAAIEAGWPIEVLLYSEELTISEYGGRLVEQFSGRSEEVSAPLLASVCGKDNPQGILAIAERRSQPLDSLHPAANGAALASPQDPGNVGTILRTLDAVGGSALFVLDGGVDPFHPTAVRAAMGSSFVIPVIEAGFSEFDIWRRGRGLQLIGSSAHSRTDYREIKAIPPWILLLGNEQKGLSASQQMACDVVACLPMRGRATSLNLAVASGILLFEYANAQT
jgi:RNA methyltransferase, TrmH family